MTRDEMISSIKTIIVASIVFMVVVYTVFIAAIIYGASHNKNDEKMVEQAMLVSSSDVELDVRRSILEKNLTDDEAWKKLYKMPISKPLNGALHDNEVTMCSLIRQYENGRSKWDIIMNDLSLLSPMRILVNSFAGRKRGSSTAFQSSVGFLFKTSKPSEIFLTSRLSHLPEEVKCRMIIGTLQASIVKGGKDYQKIVGGYSMSEVIFEKDFDELNYCEISFLASSFRSPLRAGSSRRDLNEYVYYYHTKDSTCNSFDEMERSLDGLDVAHHPLYSNLMYKNSPKNVTLKALSTLKQEMLIAHNDVMKATNINDSALFEAIIKQGDDVITVNSLGKRSFVFKDIHSGGSIVKLMIAKAAIENGENTTSERLKKMLCQSNQESANSLFDEYKDSISVQASSYRLKYGSLPLRRAVTTEDNGWATADIIRFSDDLVSLLNDKPKIVNAFGRGCTAESLLKQMQPRYVIMAKTGTAFRNGAVQSKLLLFAIRAKSENKAPVMVLIRIEGDKKAICHGDGCFSNKLFGLYLKPILNFVDENLLQ